jgi:hypothetical protein
MRRSRKYLLAVSLATSLATASVFSAGTWADGPVPPNNKTPNPSFESDLDGWSANGADLTRPTAGDAPHGGRVAKLVSDNASDFSFDDTPDSIGSSIAGETYSAKAYVKAGGTVNNNKTVGMSIREFDSNDNVVGYVDEFVALTDAAYTEVEIGYTAAGTGNDIGVHLWRASEVTNGEILYADAITVSPKVIPPNNKTSNPSFETDVSGWAASGSALTRPTDAAAPHGSNVAKLTSDNTSSYELDDDANVIASSTAGETYAAEAYLQAGGSVNDGKTAILEVREWDGSNWVDQAQQSVTLSDTAYTRASVEYMAAGDGNDISVRIYRDSQVTNGEMLLADAVSLSPAVLPPYNKMPNASFEANKHGWDAWPSGLARRTAGDAPHGTRVVETTADSSNGYGANAWPPTIAHTYAGDRYTGRAYLKGAAGADGEPVTIVLREWDGENVVAYDERDVTLSSSSWVEADIEHQAVGDGNEIDFAFFKNADVTSGESFQIDAASIVSDAIPIQNRTPNPSFEAGTSGWSASQGTLAQAADAAAPHGARTGQITAAGSDPFTIVGSTSAIASSQSGERYSARAYLKASAANDGAIATLAISEWDGTNLVDETAQEVTISEDGYVKADADYVAQADGNAINVSLRRDSQVSNGEILYADAISLIHNLIPQSNQVANPSFETTLDTWDWGDSVTRAADQAAPHGARVAKLTSTDTDSFGIDDTPATIISSDAGRTYTARAWVRAGSSANDGEQINIGMREWDSQGLVDYAEDSVELADDGYVKLEVDYAAVGGGNEIDLRVWRNDNVANEEVVYLDAVSLTPMPMPPAPPTSLNLPQVWGAPMADGPLRAHPGNWDTTSEMSTSFEWQRCDASGANCVDAEDSEADATRTLGLTTDDVGSRLRVKVTATNETGASVEYSAPTAVVRAVDSPTVDFPPRLFYLRPLDFGGSSEMDYDPGPEDPLLPGSRVVSGDVFSGWYPWQRSALNTNIGSFDEPIGMEHQWHRCDAQGESCVELETENEPDYVLAPEDQGHTVRVETTGTNASGTASITSNPSLVVDELAAPALAEPLEAPWHPFENLHVRHELAAPPSSWGAFAASVAQTYQWLRCDSDGLNCTEISGATESVYAAGTSDVGSRLRVEVTATNAAGEDSGTSDATGVVLAEEAPVLDPAEWDPFGVFAEGVALESPSLGLNDGANNSGVHGSTTRQWLRCDASGSSCTSIPDATDTHYTPIATDIGGTLRVHIEVQNSLGTHDATTEPTPTVESAPPVDPPDPPLPPEPIVVRSHPHPGNYEPGYMIAPVIEDGYPWGVSEADDWQWQRCNAAGSDCEDIAGAGGRSWHFAQYHPRWADVGSRLRVLVSHDTPDGEVVRTSTSDVIEANGPPRNLTVPEIEGSPRARERFQATPGGWAPAEPDLTFQWLRCDAEGEDCLEIPGADTARYDSSSDDLASTLRFRVTATTNLGSTQAQSSPTGTLGEPSAPENATAPTISGEAEVGETLTGAKGAWAGARPMKLSHDWLRCDEEGEECEDISEAPYSDYTVRVDDIGSTIRYSVDAQNSLGFLRQDSTQTAVVAVPDPPSNIQSPEVVGVPAVGELLSAESDSWTNHPDSFAYQWQRCDESGSSCQPIEDATARKYRVQLADIDGTLRVQITAANAGGSAQKASVHTDVVGPMEPPVSVSGPALRGTPKETHDLSVEPGSWSGGGPMSFDYQWLRCDSSGNDCTEIAGAIADTYVPGTDDLGVRLRARVHASNDAGTTNAESSRSAVIARSAPRFVEPVSIEGELRGGQELEANLDGLRGSQIIDLSYEWVRCFDTCEPIAGAEGATYELGSADEARWLRLRVLAENDVGSAKSDSSVTDPVAPESSTGPPRLAVRPFVTGRPRVTESLESNTGTWSGNAEISTEIQWQECEDTPASCQDMAGETESDYTLTPSNEGKYVRSVVTASNGLGTVTQATAMTAEINPEFHTVTEFKKGVLLEDVLDAFDQEGVRLLQLTFSGGGYLNRDNATASEVYDAINSNTPGGAANRSALTVYSWGSAIPDWVEDHAAGSASVVPGRAADPVIQEPEPAPDPSEFGRNLQLMSRAEIWGVEDVTPVGGSEIAERAVFTQFTWAKNSDWLDDYVEGLPVLPGWGVALEMNTAQVNHGNAEQPLPSPVPDGLVCWPTEWNNFWIDETEDVLFQAPSLPDDAGLYFDIPLFDGCEYRDLSYGILRPETLAQDEGYNVQMYFMDDDAAGDTEDSTIKWGVQLLDRPPGCGTWAQDVYPPPIPPVPPLPPSAREPAACIGLLPLGNGDTYIDDHPDVDRRLPGCWEFIEGRPLKPNGEPPPATQECIFET